MLTCQRNTLPTGRVSALIFVLIFAACGSKNQVNPILDTEMPRKIIWAWERPEDLRFLDPKEFGVAFLAQTITLEQDRVMSRQRRQPLEIAEGTYVIAVTRIETIKEYGKRPTYDDEMASRIAVRIWGTLNLPNVKAMQIDFDAVASERDFYRKIVKYLVDFDNTVTSGSPHRITMTSLASWCTGDAWFNDFPVDEAVPMVFEMGADSDKIKNYLRNGNDWTEPLCRASYGISLDEGRFEGMKDGRRMYYFKSSPWKPDDINAL